MNNCKQCETEGLISMCCNHSVQFMAIGAAKCSKCKKFTKLKPCDSCKEENSIQTYQVPVEEHNSNNKATGMSKNQTILILAIIITYVVTIYAMSLYMYK